MATSANDCFNLLKYRANKAGYNGYISPENFNLLFPRSEKRIFNRLYAEYYKTQRISDSLSKFMSDPVALTMATSGGTAGQYTITQTDLAHIDSITHTITSIQYPVVRVEKDRLANWLSSQVQAPSAQFPIYTEFNTYLQFYPLTLATATMIYLKYPVSTVWAYTISGATSLNTLVGGSSYTTGTYLARPLTGGTGTGITANITVAGGAVTAVTIVSGGSNYVVGDTLSVNNSQVGGTGSGFSIKVATVATNRPVYNPTASVSCSFADSDIDNIIYLCLQDIGVNMADPSLQQWAMVESKTQI